MSIVNLRKRLNGLVRIRNTYINAAEPLVDMCAPFTALFAHNQNHYYSEDKYLPEHFEAVDERAESLIGETLWIFEKEFTNALFSMEFIGSNIRSYIDELVSDLYVTDDIDEVEVGSEPVLEGWLTTEVQMVVNAYEKKIHRLETSLERANHCAHKLGGYRSVMPKWIQSSVMGLFGKPNLLSEYQYTDQDFVYCHNDKPTSQPRIMTAKWLAPIYGLDIARKVEECIEILKKQHNSLS